MLSLQPQNKVNCCSLLTEGANKVFFPKRCLFLILIDKKQCLDTTEGREWVGCKTTDRKDEQEECLCFFCCWWFALFNHVLRILFLISAWLWTSQWNTVYRNDFWVEIWRFFTVGMDMYNEIKFTAGAQGSRCFLSVPRLLHFNCNDDLILKYKH